MQKIRYRKAVIYCRVSDIKQKTHGSGLTSQEHRCRQYAEGRNYIVEKVFADDITGGGSYTKRPALTALLAYLEENSETDYVVIFDDLKRFARDLSYHLDLKKNLKLYNADVECPNYRFGDTPEDEYAEQILAAGNELERKQGRRQTMQKMKAKMEQGFYQFQIPKGYEYKHVKYKGKLVFRHEPVASIVTEALEGFASGRFQTKAEVQRFLSAQPDFPRGKSGEVVAQHVDELLRNIFYTGYYSFEAWDIPFMQGRHEPLINYETHVKILERLEGRALAPARKNINADFPLRGFVLCSCGHPMTAAWSKGRSSEHPYYFCQNKGCEHRKKSIRRKLIEDDFETILKNIKPAAILMKSSEKMFEKLWNHRQNYQEQHKAALNKHLKKMEQEVDKLVDRLVATDLTTVAQACETKIQNLESQKIIVKEKSPILPLPFTRSRQLIEPLYNFSRTPMKYGLPGH